MRFHVTKEPAATQAVCESHAYSVVALLSPEELRVLPKSIIVELSAPAGEGDRRRQMKPVVINMIANGFEPDRVYSLIRPMYEPSFTSKEIWDFVDWAHKRKERWTSTEEFLRTAGHQTSRSRRTLSSEERIDNTDKFLKGFRCTPEDLLSQSPLKFSNWAPQDTACLYLETKYKLCDLLNIILDFNLDKDGKPCPYGAGITRSVYQWVRCISGNGVPHSDAGCKHRINPVRPVNLKAGVNWTEWCGSGYEGAFTGGDIDQVIYVMAESDLLSLDTQSSVLAKLPLPISSILDTGNHSLHAAILLTGGPAEARAILERLYCLGFDSNTSSACQLERMPGDIRQIGARDTGGTMQRLLYLNPTPTREPMCV